VLGHRGASADAPENTIAAFRLALDQGADGVELDVWRCGTGEVVVCHDPDARRLAGSPLVVPEASLRDLRALDVGSWKGARWSGERIPRLEEALEAMPGAIVNVELKSRGGETELSRAAAEVIRAARAADRVVVSSFDWRLVSAFQSAAPEIAVGLLFEGSRAWRLRVAMASRLLGPQALHPHRALATPARVRAWTRRGLAVNVWTVDDAAEMRHLAALGVSAVITNVPGRAVEALRNPSPAAR
jgi:glycerophosphoryl diester phosphodiesterase